jgi:integrase
MSRKNRTHRTTAARRRRRRKPVLVKAGSVVVKIRQSPLVINGKKYPSFIVDYYANGRRYRERRNTARKARALADAVVAKLVKGELQALELTGEDRRIYLLALENLKDIGVGLDAATREYADAKKISKNADLREVARFRQRYGQTDIKKGKVPDLVRMLLSDLARDKRGDYHIRDLDLRLGRFAKDFPGLIDEIDTRPIDDWLGGLKSLSRHGQKKEISGRTRNNYRNAVVELFNYAQTHDYLPKGIPTPAQATKTVDEVTRENEIFRPEDMARLLNEAPARLVPSMAIKAFNGVRTEEMAFMEWSHVALKKGYIILPKTITKKKKRRIIRIWKNLRLWLEPFAGLSGRICWQWSTPQAVFQAWERAATKLGIRAGGNRFRNSYISYRVAQTGDIQRVSLETGNSPDVIEEDYLELATEEDAEKWFKIRPSPKRLAELRACAKEWAENPTALLDGDDTVG